MYDAMKRLISSTLAFLLVVGPCAAAHGGVISTASALEMQVRHERIERIDAFLTRDEVRTALTIRGVDSADALQRVNALTDAEVQHLALQIDELPSGGVGVVGIVGIVGVVLVILELLGVTNVFTNF
jgi:hypothetical protein